MSAREQSAVRSAQARLSQAARALSEIGNDIAQDRWGDCSHADAHKAAFAAARTFESALVAYREAIATLIGSPETEDVSDAEGFENALIGAVDRLYGAEPDAILVRRAQERGRTIAADLDSAQVAA